MGLENFNSKQITEEAILSYFKTYDMEDSVIIEEDTPTERTSLEDLAFYRYISYIPITGNHQGQIVVTCEKGFLFEFIKLVVGPRIVVKDDDLKDMIGEIANTIAGYFQKFYGDKFILSYPIFVHDEEKKDIKEKLSKDFDAVYFDWIGYKAKVLIHLSN